MVLMMVSTMTNDVNQTHVLRVYPIPISQATLKTIACGSGGIFQAIPDGGSLSTAMSGYYRSVVKMNRRGPLSSYVCAPSGGGKVTTHETSDDNRMFPIDGPAAVPTSSNELGQQTVPERNNNGLLHTIGLLHGGEVEWNGCKVSPHAGPTS